MLFRANALLRIELVRLLKVLPRQLVIVAIDGRNAARVQARNPVGHGLLVLHQVSDLAGIGRSNLADGLAAPLLLHA